MSERDARAVEPSVPSAPPEATRRTTEQAAPPSLSQIEDVERTVSTAEVPAVPRTPAPPVDRVFRQPASTLSRGAAAQAPRLLRAEEVVAQASMPVARSTSSSGASTSDEARFAEASARGGPVAVMREEDPSAQAASAAPEPGPDAAEVDARTIERLAQQVYARLRRRLVVERERADGGGRWS